MIYFLILFSALQAFAQFDLTYGAQGRSLPGIGAELYGESGYNQKLWGKKETPKDFLYGLIRPSFGLSSSGVINSMKGELEVFPISIFGVSAGRQIQYSNYEFPFFDCDKVACRGQYERNWIETKMVLGFKGWVALANYKIDTITGPNDHDPMADWRHVIIGNAGHDVQIERKLLVGKMFSNKLVGILAEAAEFEGSGQKKESFVGVYQVRVNDTNYMIGAGSFRTSEQAMGLIFYFRLHHVAIPSLKLF